MRQLILMRHGKAETAAEHGDHARPLAPRGRAEAREAGLRLSALARPGFALASDSTRTRETFENAALAPALPHRFTRALYDATAEAILAEVRATPDTVDSLLVIGHNPGIGDLARRLAGDGTAEDLARLGEGFPTSCFAILDIDADRWAGVGGAGRLAYLFPADARSGA